MSSASTIKLSICVAVYDLGGCLPDFFATLEKISGRDTVEFVFVDDCSTDESPEIIRRWMNGKSNSFYIKNKVNAGLYETRMVAAEAARGDYIWFVDGDDVLDGDGIEQILTTLESANGSLDALVLEYVEFSDRVPQRLWPAGKISFRLMLTSEQFLEPFAGRHNIWRFIIKRKIASRFYAENVVADDFGEDFIFTSALHRCVQCFVYVPAPVYLYRRGRAGSFTGGVSRLERVERNLEFIEHVTNLCDFHLDRFATSSWAARHYALLASMEKRARGQISDEVITLCQRFAQRLDVNKDHFSVFCLMIDEWNKSMGRIPRHDSAGVLWDEFYTLRRAEA